MRFVHGHNGRKVKGGLYRVEDRGHDTPCWIWTGATTVAGERGYGYYRKRAAHRVFFEEARGPVPEGMQLDHLCRVRLCVNPDHLEVVTLLENVRRSRRAKLTYEQAVEIHHHFAASGQPKKRFARECADEYGVGPGTILSLLSGKTWRDAREEAAA